MLIQNHKEIQLVDIRSFHSQSAELKLIDIDHRRIDLGHKTKGLKHDTRN